MKPRSNCMPSTTSTSVSMLLDSSTVMTPSLPTFSMASAIMLADLGVVVRGDGGDVGDLLLLLDVLALFLMSSTAISTAVVDAALEAMGSSPAATDLRPSLKIAVGEHGGGRGAVAGDVVGLRGDFLQKLGAHVLVGVFELDFLGDGDAVLGDGGGAELLIQ